MWWGKNGNHMSNPLREKKKKEGKKQQKINETVVLSSLRKGMRRVLC